MRLKYETYDALEGVYQVSHIPLNILKNTPYP